MLKKMQMSLALLLIVGALSSCTMRHANKACANIAPTTTIAQATKWYRTAAEKTASYRQGYALGTRYVESWVKMHHPKKHSWGVILDIDETVLDNSWYFELCSATLSLEGDFSRRISLAKKSHALPGAKAFINFVHKLGGYVSLVSNRDGSCCDGEGSVLEATKENLIAQGIYFDQVVLANHTDAPNAKDKNPRFQAVISGNYDPKLMAISNPLPPHHVIAFFGDNIQDFPELTQKSMRELKDDDAKFERFSDGFFVFPNPIYGSWNAAKYEKAD